MPPPCIRKPLTPPHPTATTPGPFRGSAGRARSLERTGVGWEGGRKPLDEWGKWVASSVYELQCGLFFQCTLPSFPSVFTPTASPSLLSVGFLNMQRRHAQGLRPVGTSGPRTLHGHMYLLSFVTPDQASPREELGLGLSHPQVIIC